MIHLLMAKCNQNIGVLYAEMKRPEEAMNYYRKALIYTGLLKNRDDEAGVIQNIGIIYEDEKKYKEALGYYLSALKIFIKPARQHFNGHNVSQSGKPV